MIRDRTLSGKIEKKEKEKIIIIKKERKA